MPPPSSSSFIQHILYRTCPRQSEWVTACGQIVLMLRLLLYFGGCVCVFLFCIRPWPVSTHTFTRLYVCKSFDRFHSLFLFLMFVYIFRYLCLPFNFSGWIICCVNVKELVYYGCCCFVSFRFFPFLFFSFFVLFCRGCCCCCLYTWWILNQIARKYIKLSRCCEQREHLSDGFRF